MGRPGFTSRSSGLQLDSEQAPKLIVSVFLSVKQTGGGEKSC